jgi:hypothetical protein
MCFQNESLDIAIWTTSKQIATKVIKSWFQKHHEINLCLHGLLQIVNHKRDIRTLTIEQQLYTLNH